MKLVVDNIPKKSIECLFSYKDHPSMSHRCCSFDYGVCRLDEDGESCEYLEERNQTK